MEATGPDVKRPRLNYDGPPRMASSSQQQHPPPPISPAHANNPSILPAPSTYPGPLQQQAPPPSPFHDAPHDVRTIPAEPNVHSFAQHHSGHTTPREGRFSHEMNYSRRGSTSGTPRSPEDHPHSHPPRSMSMGNPNDAPAYPNHYPNDAAGHLIGYQAPDQHMNGSVHHGLPMHGEGPIAYAEYGPSMHPGAHPYAGGPYGGPMQVQGLRPKKGNRAQQV